MLGFADSISKGSPQYPDSLVSHFVISGGDPAGVGIIDQYGGLISGLSPNITGND